MAFGCLTLAHCGSSSKFTNKLDPQYGVSASPRVVQSGEPVPKVAWPTLILLVLALSLLAWATTREVLTAGDITSGVERYRGRAGAEQLRYLANRSQKGPAFPMGGPVLFA